ncbi:hypothetical protein D3C83_43930 [compost metagenome]
MSHALSICGSACSIRCPISSSVSELKGCAITTGSKPAMPSASRCVCASSTNSAVAIIAVGRPFASSITESCIQHDVQDPQSAMAVSTMSLLAAISSINSGAALSEKLCLR